MYCRSVAHRHDTYEQSNDRPDHNWRSNASVTAQPGILARPRYLAIIFLYDQVGGREIANVYRPCSASFTSINFAASPLPYHKLLFLAAERAQHVRSYILFYKEPR